MLSLIISYLTYSYPPFPNTNNGITNWIIGLFEWIFEVPLIAIANLIAGIGNGFTNGAQTSASNVAGFVGTTFNNSLSAFQSFGVLAPIIASAIWGGAIIILIFFIFKAIQLGTREMEED